MRFQPKTDAELADENFGPGVYDFEVVEAEDTQSQAGNDMIVVKLRLWNKGGKTITVRDWLLEAMAFKLKHAADSMGLLAVYQKGELSADHVTGRTGRVVCVHDAKGYLKVKDYEVGKAQPTARAVPAARPAPARQPVAAGEGIDDEIPF